MLDPVAAEALLEPSTVPAPSTSSSKPIPAGLTPYTEQSTTILLPDDNTAFLNPVQQFNRDLSISVISTWGKVWQEEGRKDWEDKRVKKLAKKGGKKGGKGKGKQQEEPVAAAAAAAVDSAQEPAAAADVTASETDAAAEVAEPVNAEASTSKTPDYQPKEFVILEALSATGLRAIRYAKEIPGVKYVIANDLSPTAATAMRRNVDYNEQGAKDTKPTDGYWGARESAGKEEWKGKVRVNEGDALMLMYSHRADRVDMIDLDPYGTAAPFLDSAIQAVSDGGLLAVTCTDMAVTAGHNYPEKCFANYGGVSAKADYSHEVALRLLLNSCNNVAARYGRYIVPLVSLSIDFYMRVFFRVYTSQLEVKRSFAKSGSVYVCGGCQQFHIQPFGRVKEQESKNGKNVNHLYKTAGGPPVDQRCADCNFTHHLAGPLWIGPLHDPSFCSRVLEHVAANEDKFSTVPRMKGMLSLARDELEAPFYFDPSFISGLFHCTCPPINDIASALLHAGFKVSRSHAASGSIKTTATMSFVLDVFRSLIKQKFPVKMEKIKAGSPAAALLAVEPKIEANFELHPETTTQISRTKLVRYQVNPRANWGPAGRAKNKAAKVDGSNKRKAEGTEGEQAPKKEKLDEAEETATDEPMDDEEAAFNA